MLQLRPEMLAFSLRVQERAVGAGDWTDGGGQELSLIKSQLRDRHNAKSFDISFIPLKPKEIDIVSGRCR